MPESQIESVILKNKKEWTMDGVNLHELAERYGTPLYVTSQRRIQERFENIREAFLSFNWNFEIKYAIKANSNPRIVEILSRMGAGADVSNLTEYEIALRGGVAKEKIVMTPNNLDKNSLSQASDYGLAINFDDINQMNLLGRKLPHTVSFRINPGVGKGEFQGTTTAGPDAKFGIPSERSLEAYRVARDQGAKKFGIHMMTGSNVLDADYFGFVAGKLFALVRKISNELGIEFEYVDLGGGFGVPYRSGEKELDLKKVAQGVWNSMNKNYEGYDGKLPKILLEPGRYLVADSTILIGRVTNVKEYGKRFIGTDLGMTTLLRPALYGAYHPIVVLADHGGAEREGKIVGQVCENTDVIVNWRSIPDVKIDDLIAVLNAGAYGYAMSMNFNGNLRSSEVLISNGKAYLVRKRETVEDLLQNVV